MRAAVLTIVAMTLAWAGVAEAQHVHSDTTPAGSQAPAAPAAPPAAHQHVETAPLPPFVPMLTDADRAAAFPDVGDHEVHGTSMQSLVLFDHVEWRSGTGAESVVVDARGWVGGDLDRLWFRTDVAGRGGRVHDATAEVFYGRAIARWWDVVAGVRQDVEPGPARTWAAIGIQGLAPYWFEVEATAYVGAAGRTHLHLATEYELLITNRLVLQPAASMDIFGKADPVRNAGAGVGAVEGALRLRYEIRREFAPYIGVVWQRRTFGSADLARTVGEPVGETRFVTGARVWF
ncbi:MAG: copper resistance protein B [Acidobacteria bacterium]|nr:copper resistance protein B [Acidobacteriota bacterium]